MKTKYKFIYFEKQEHQTKPFPDWSIFNNKYGDYLGDIMWHNRWKEYELVPNQKLEVGFTEECLLDIVDFIRQLDEERKG